MTHPTKPTAGPPALSSPVEDDRARAMALGRKALLARGSTAQVAVLTEGLAAEFARIRAEAVAAEREARDKEWAKALGDSMSAIGTSVIINNGASDKLNELYAIGMGWRARDPAPAQQEETHEKD